MAGTPPMEVMRSCSTRAMAFSASNLRIITIFTPIAMARLSSEKQPVTWNSGMPSR